jgi:hypothetical protein
VLDNETARDESRAASIQHGWNGIAYEPMRASHARTVF